jgi:hypothetical protein
LRGLAANRAVACRAFIRCRHGFSAPALTRRWCRSFRRSNRHTIRGCVDVPAARSNRREEPEQIIAAIFGRLFHPALSTPCARDAHPEESRALAAGTAPASCHVAFILLSGPWRTADEWIDESTILLHHTPIMNTN